MGAGLPRAAQHRRADQEGRRRPERPRADRPDLRAGRVPVDRQAGPALADAVVRPLHAAQAGRAGRAHRLGRARGARGRVLHDADPDRRRADDERAAARDRVGERAVRARRRRRHRPAERAAALDPHRGRARRSSSGSTPSGSRRRRRAATRPRVFLGCPLAGVTADEVLDATADIRAVASRYLGDPAFSNLPRKYKTSISGCRVHCTNPEINDISLVGVDHPTLGAGYDLQVGGGLSTNPMFAQRLGAFVRAGARARGLGRRDGTVPRVRVPAVAEPRAVEVPGEGLGSRAGARGPGAGVPGRRRAARRAGSGAATAGRPRPRRRARAAGRAGVRGVRAARGTRRRTPAAARGRPRRRVRRRAAAPRPRSRSS